MVSEARQESSVQLMRMSDIVRMESPLSTIERMKAYKSYLTLPFNLKAHFQWLLDTTQTGKPINFDLNNARLVWDIFVNKRIELYGFHKDGYHGYNYADSLFNKDTGQYGCCGHRATQLRGSNHPCEKMGTRVWRDYRHIRLNFVYICLLCCVGVNSPRNLCVHYLMHSYADCILLGLSPNILRMAVEAEDKPMAKRYGTKVTKYKQFLETPRDKYHREIGELIVRGSFNGTRMDVRNFSYDKTLVNAALFEPDLGIWNQKIIPAITELEVSMLATNDLNHRMLKPFWPATNTLLRHLVKFEGCELLVSSYYEHVVIVYTSAALDYIQGGVAQLMKQIGYCR